VDRFALPVSSQPCGELIGGVEQPGIAGFGGEQDQLTDTTGRPSFTPITIPAEWPPSSATRPISSARSLDRKISNIFA